jgi:hypothetical protein
MASRLAVPPTAGNLLGDRVTLVRDSLLDLDEDRQRPEVVPEDPRRRACS